MFDADVLTDICMFGVDGFINKDMAIVSSSFSSFSFFSFFSFSSFCSCNLIFSSFLPQSLLVDIGPYSFISPNVELGGISSVRTSIILLL